MKLSPKEVLEKVISFPTVSRDTNLPLMEWVASYLKSHDIDAHIWPDPKQPHKAALFAHVGPWEEGAVVLSGHTDVVPVDGQPWSSDPFTLTERDGKYFGRGTCDMKGFDALAIWAMVEAKYLGIKRPLQLALSFDEEIGCTGAPPMIEAMQEVLPKGSAVIVGEPSMMQVVTGHKGNYGYFTHLSGFEVHSSIMHTGVNAVMAAAPLIDWANKRNAQGEAAEPSDVASNFTPHWTTCHVGTIEGGTATNITAKDCRFMMDFRVVPGEKPEDWQNEYFALAREAEARMQSVHSEAKIDISEVFAVPPLAPENDGEAEEIARALTGDNTRRAVSYATEAGQFQEAGYSAVICGPGNIEQAHQPDEFISVAQFNAGREFLERLLSRISE